MKNTILAARHARFAYPAGSSLIALALAISPAYAQDTTPADAAAQDAADESAPSDIVVTGSRLGSGFEAPTPVTTVGQQQIEDRVFGAVAELAYDIPQLRQNWNIGRSSEPVGQNQPDLRALGSARTLVLLDGRRLAATSPFGGIDTNVFPVALISGVEVVTGGASAAYGSDAVAGVLNFQLNKTLDGIKVDASYGESKYGDFKRPIISAAYGANLLDDRLHVTVAGDYYHNTGQTKQSSRPWGKGQNALFAIPNYKARGLTQYVIAPNANFAKMTFGGLIVAAPGSPLRGIQFGPGGTPMPFQYGTEIGSVFQLNGGGVNVTDEGNIGVDIERFSGFGRVDFEISSNAKIWAEAMYTHVDVFSDLAPNYDNGDLTIRQDNAYLPASIRNIMIANGIQSFAFGRMQLYDDGLSENNSETDVRRYAIGAEGSFGEGWEWDAYAQISRNSFYQESVNNRVKTRWTNAVDSVISPTTGQPVCRINVDAVTTNDDPACVPANVFGAGSISQASLNYYRGTSFYDADMNQDVFGFNLRGEPFSTWAGPVNLAFGGEYRREKIDSVSDPISQISGWRSINQQPFSGKLNVKEVYAEVGVPLLEDAPFADSLELNAAVRYADYSSSGGVVPWKIGLNYSPVPDIRFRGTISRDIRAANINELYSGQNQVIRGEPDPRCTTNAAIPCNYFITSLTGGNPNLDPEKADTKAIGVVWQPSFLPGFNASIDYYSIKVKDAITSLPSATIIANCYTANIQQYCGYLSLLPNSQISTVQATLLNINSVETAGIDFEATYRRTLGPGTVGTRLLVNWVDKLLVGTEGGQIDYVGDLATDYAGQPEWKWNFDLTYDLDRFRAGLFLRYLGGGKVRSFYVDDVDLPAAQNNIDGKLYTNISAAYKITDNIEVYGKVDNLFNIDPPIAPNVIVMPSIANSQMFDKIGRYYVGGVRLRF